ncbi:MAG: radical SAM protein [Candidatus Nezhaarchaeales archaeon]
MSVVIPFDPWKGKLCTCPPKYSFSPYTGCSHGCLYCYATSYIKVTNSRPKADLERKLIRDLVRIIRELPISIANSSDPYPPIESKLHITRRCLEMLLPRGLKVMIITKSNIIVRDIDLISKGNCAVSFTVTTLDDKLASIIEPGAPRPSDRIKAIKRLSQEGVPCIARIDPIIPGLNDDYTNLRKLVEELVKSGVKHISSSTYKAKPDNLARMTRAFPERAKYWYSLYYEEGFKVGASRYLKDDMRFNLMKTIKEIVDEHGISFSTCREGFKNLNTSTTCDGTHLIPLRIRLVGL